MDDALYVEMAAVERSYWWFVAKRRILQHLLKRHLAPEADLDSRRARILDIGCGTGALLEELRAQGFRVRGCDTHAVSLATCRRLGLDVDSGRLPDDIDYEAESFDAVVMSDVLEHVDDDAASVARAASLLRPNGIMLCTVPAHPWLWTARDELHHHKRRYRRKDFRALFRRPGLREEILSYYNSALFPLMVVQRTLTLRARSASGPDIEPLPRPFNSLLRAIFETEKWLLGRLSLPFGGSLLALHRRVS